MSTITLDQLQLYGDQLTLIADEAQAIFEIMARDVLGDIDFSSTTREQRKEIKNKLVDIINDIQSSYGVSSSSIATLLLEQIAEKEGFDISIYQSEVANNNQIEKSIGYHSKFLYQDEPDLDTFIRGMRGFVQRITYHASDFSMADSAVEANKHLPKEYRMRFARVPQGASCGFCIMLASRGFVYANEKTAGKLKKYHNHCDCSIVAGFPGTDVEGYTPEFWQKQYSKCRDTLTHGDPTGGQVWNDWKKLPAEEKLKYLGDNGKPSFNEYLEQRIIEEMDSRSRNWLYDGRSATANLKTRDIKPHEFRAYSELLSNGIDIEVLKVKGEDRSNKKSSPDLIIDGARWELKCPDGDNKNRTINRNINKAIKQLKNANPPSEKMNVVLSALETSLDEKDIVDVINTKINNGELDELILIRKNGEIWRFKK